MTLLLAALLLAADPPHPAAAPGTTAADRPGAVRTVSGKLSEVKLAERRVLLEAADGPVVLNLDRNTSVYLESRLGTTRDLAVGIPARASVGPDGEAYWIELRPKGVLPTRAVEVPNGAATSTGSSTPTPTGTATPTPTATPTGTGNTEAKP